MRHDEQECEAHYDDRSEDAIGKLQFPKSKLFGREKELGLVRQLYDSATSLDCSVHTPDTPDTPDEVDDVDNSDIQHNNCDTDPNISSHVIYIDGTAGIGKSALVEQLVMELEEAHKPFYLAMGKYNSTTSSADPLSAISQAISKLGRDLVTRARQSGDRDQLDQIRKRLDDAGIFRSEEAPLLLHLAPGLAPLLKEKEVPVSRGNGNDYAQVSDLKQLSYVLGNFLRAICTKEQPMLLFIDDLQWADAASLELLKPLLSEYSIPHFLFIGSYRTNEVTDDHILTKHMTEVEGKRRIHRISLSNLSPHDVEAFIAETLRMSTEEVSPLTELVYSKTLGNIFFCRHALEELHRKNAIYYDVMTFVWTFNVATNDKMESLEDLLSDDIITMVQSKLQTLSEPAQRALVLASYIRNTISIPALYAVFKADGYKGYSRDEFVELLDEAVAEGLLLRTTRQASSSASSSAASSSSAEGDYKFSHDRVQEAAYKSLMPGEERDNVLVRIATVLTGIATMSNRSEDEWMLFVAVDHFNSIPVDMVPDRYHLARMNLRMGKIALGKASFEKAVSLLRAASLGLEYHKGKWNNYYTFCLELYNRLIETESAMGNHTEAREAINAVLVNAKSHQDKCTAYFNHIQLAVKSNNSNHAVGVAESLRILNECGVKIPDEPTSNDLTKERFKLAMKLRGRTITYLSELSFMEEDWIMELIAQLCHLANLSGANMLNQYVTLRAIRLTAEKGVSKHLCRVLLNATVPLRRKEKFDMAYSYASIVSRVYERFPEERGGDYAFGQMVLHSGVMPLKVSFKAGISPFLNTYEVALRAGNTENALTCAMHFPLNYFASGLPLNALLEPKLILFEDKARQLQQSSYAAIFQYSRQFLYNIQGKSDNPTRLKGTAVDEDELLAGLEGKSKKMTLRDLSIHRMFLAYLFDDSATMEVLIARLDEFPLFDLPVVRQHLRLTYNGLACLQLGREKGESEYTKLGKSMMVELQKLAKVGSVNAIPAYQCLLAVFKNRKRAFTTAIDTCKQEGLMHMEAMMCEKCGLMLLSKGDMAGAKEYLGKSLWLFNDWGAVAKVRQLKDRFDFLIDFPRSAVSVSSSSGGKALIAAARLGLRERKRIESSRKSSRKLKKAAQAA